MSNVISPEKAAVMTDESLKGESKTESLKSESLKSEDQRKKELELEKDNMKKWLLAGLETTISNTLECSKCKMKTVSYSQAQTRSADEPMTTFCECIDCGHRWKFAS